MRKILFILAPLIFLLTFSTACIAFEEAGSSTPDSIEVVATEIEATYTGGTIYTSTSLDTIKTSINVEKIYSDSTSEPVTDFSVDGNLLAGECVLTVTVDDLQTEVTVTVVEVAPTGIDVQFDKASNVIFDSAVLEDLKQYVTVTVSNNDGSTNVLNAQEYAVTGTMEAGTQTFTITYNGFTGTFSTEIIASVTGINVTIAEDYKIKPTATIDEVKALLTVNAIKSNGTSEVVTDYSITGEIGAGECDFVVSYADFSQTVTITFTLADVIVEVEEGRDIRVLQITDTQIIDCDQSTGYVDYAWYANRMHEELFRYIEDAVVRTNPDLIILTGDMIYGQFDNNGTAFQALIECMESFEIPWAPVFGNHENESAKGVAWQCEQLENAEYCLFKRGTLTDTNGNYTVGVMQGDELVRVFYMMDTNGCGAAFNKEGNNGVTEVGGFTQEQINWLGNGMFAFNKYYPEVEISICFHIPTTEMESAVQTYGSLSESFAIGIEKTSKNGDFGEYRCRTVSARPAPSYKGRSFLNLLQESGVDTVFMGHDHENNVSISYGGIRWTYGLKTGRYDEIYVDNLGGTLITFDDSTIDVRHVYYNEEYQAEMDALRDNGTYTEKTTWSVKSTDKHLAVETKTTDEDKNGQIITFSENTTVGGVNVPAGKYFHLNLEKGVGARFANFANRYEAGKTYQFTVEGYGISYNSGNLLLLYSSRGTQSSLSPSTANLNYNNLGNGLYRVTATFVAKDTYTIGWYNTSSTMQEWYITSMTLTESDREVAKFELGENINFSQYITDVTNDGSMSAVEWVEEKVCDYTTGLHVMAQPTSGSMVRFEALGTPVMKTGKAYKITWISTYIGDTSSMVVLNFNDADKPVATPIEGTSLYEYTYVSTTSSSFSYIVLYNLPNGAARDFTIYEITCEEVRSYYHDVTVEEIAQSGGYTFDWSEGNKVEISPSNSSASMDYCKISEMEDASLKNKLQATGKYVNDYALEYYNPAGGAYITCMENKFTVGVTYTITFEAYFLADSICWLTMTANKEQNGSEIGISWKQLTDVSSDGKYWRATATFTAKEGDANISLYAKGNSHFYISYMNISAQA